MQQLDLFATLRPPAIRLPCDPLGPVIQGDCDESHILPHPRMAWHLAEIDLHRHTDGLWMWAVTMFCGGYRVGPKWGQFAETRDDALHWAIEELLGRLDRASGSGMGVTSAHIESIRTWAERLRP